MDTSSSVSLRVRCLKATNIRVETGVGTLLKDFTTQLEALTDIPADSMALLKGYPPKRIDYDRNTGTVADLGLKSQDTLIVERDKNLSNAGENNGVAKNVGNNISPNVMSQGPSHPPNNPISTSSFNSSVASTANVEDRLGANLPPYFLASDTDQMMGLRQSSSTDAEGSERIPEVPLNSTRSASNLYNEMLAQSTAAASYGGEYNGVVMRHVVPADNSCLFTSVAFCLADVEHIQDTNYLRELIAATVASDPEKYNEAFLGQSNADYCAWIKKPESWGGGIEVAILSEFYGYEITVVNIQSLNLSRFGEDKNYTQRMLLLYDGIHYDPLYMEIFETNQQKRLFPTSNTNILDQALDLAKEAKRAHQYTDVKNFKLRCNRCNKLLTGETEAQQHAKTTGHIDFAEIV